MSTGLKAPARNSVEEPAFEIPDEDWFEAELVGWTDPVMSQYPIKYGDRAGEYPMVVALRYQLKGEGNDYEIRTRLFDPENPHDKTQIENQRALAGREVGDDEDFDYGDYVGKLVRILVVHKDKTTNVNGTNTTRTYANIAKVSPAKKKAKPQAEEFPED